MTDEQTEPAVEPISFTQAITHTVERWPARTSFGQPYLDYLIHAHQGTVDGDTVRFSIFNGGAEYRLRRDLPMDGENVVADLVPDSGVVRRRKL